MLTWAPPDFEFWRGLARAHHVNYMGIEALQTLQLFILRDVRANLSCALSSYQIEPTARDIPQNYIGIDALKPYSQLFILRDV